MSYDMVLIYDITEVLTVCWTVDAVYRHKADFTI